MIDTLFGQLASYGISEAIRLLSEACALAIKKNKHLSDWERVFVDSGKFFSEHENDSSPFFDDLERALSAENMSSIATDLETVTGYELKDKLYTKLMALMENYSIPHELAHSYSVGILYVILSQLKDIDSSKFDQQFQQDWKTEQETALTELREIFLKMHNDIERFCSSGIEILSSSQMDSYLRTCTNNVSIGIPFFKVDDTKFQELFAQHQYDDSVFIRGRCQEEAIYCVLNELWRMQEPRPIYIIKNLHSWNLLQDSSSEGNIYIPFFYADEIPVIKNNTNIFVLGENTPAHSRNIIQLRPRTYTTISECLQEAGMDSQSAHKLISDTHGLYIPMKKHLFNGAYNKMPAWVDRLDDKTKKICLLIGKWEENEGDKLVISELYGGSYDDFIQSVLPFTTGEDPFIYKSSRHNINRYDLASTETTWECIDVSLDDPMWKKFIHLFLEIINESESLFYHGHKERLLAQIKGECLFWSASIRKGMFRTLIMKSFYTNDLKCQLSMDHLVSSILDHVQEKKQWEYITQFWTELCEISPSAVLDRLEKELESSTGLLELFENQKEDILFERNAYIDILFGVEQFFSQKDYFGRAFRWLLQIDRKNFHYVSNSPKDIFSKLFCTWYNFSVLQNAEEKISAAKLALETDENAWEYIYNSLHSHRSIIGSITTPNYRNHIEESETTYADMNRTSVGYCNLLLKYANNSVARWCDLISLSCGIKIDERTQILDQLLLQVKDMSDFGMMKIKNNIRHQIFRHRYYTTSSWTLDESELAKYEAVMNSINTKDAEYEYVYLFTGTYDFPLLHPTPYEDDNSSEKNRIAKEDLIKEKIDEFRNNNCRLDLLVDICAKEPDNSLGHYLAAYWDNCVWNWNTFKLLISKEQYENMALEYTTIALQDSPDLYEKAIEKAISSGRSIDFLTRMYQQEARITYNRPLIASSSETVKKQFWHTPIVCRECNAMWALSESKKYSDLDTFIQNLYYTHRQTHLTPDDLLSYFDDIESKTRDTSSNLSEYYIKELLKTLQTAFLSDNEKCMRIAQIEIYFTNLLEPEDLKCFNRIIKSSPNLLADIVNIVFKHDHQVNDSCDWDGQYVNNMYSIYNKLQFCPTETNGIVNEYDLEQWILQFKQKLKDNDQSSLFTSVLGRLFSFSPLGNDGHEPCEAVRTMIEKYGDEKLQTNYEICIFNRRGVFSPSAGKQEEFLARTFKENADHLCSLYPKTAQIFYNISDKYRLESEQERKDAENGWI